MNSNKIILTEFSVSHSEIMHTVISFLAASGYEVHVWINKDADFDKTILPSSVRFNSRKNSGIYSNITFTAGLIFYILRNGISKVYINTAHGLLVRNFCLLARLFRFEVIGLMHHGEKMRGSKTQDLISKKIRKYFVLSDYIKSNMEKEHGGKYRFSVFYPVILKNPPADINVRNDESILICIPGEVSDKRKNYRVFLDNVRKSKDSVKGKIVFDILGRIKYERNRKYIEEMKTPELENFFITYDGYISNDLFYKRISECSLILPLIMPGVENFDNYLKYQISGAYNMAYAFKKPLLLHESFRDFEEFRDISVFYNEDNLGAVIEGLTGNKYNTANLRQNIVTSKRLDFEYQRKKFMEFINSVR